MSYYELDLAIPEERHVMITLLKCRSDRGLFAVTALPASEYIIHSVYDVLKGRNNGVIAIVCNILLKSCS